MSDGDDDRIGYKKPPKEHQFKKGKSGNPRGRPKKQATSHSSWGDLVYDELQRIVAVKENGKTVHLSVEQAFIRHVVQRAFQGNPPAIRALERFIKDGRNSAKAVLWPEPGEIAAMDPHRAAEAYRRLMGDLNRAAGN